jgi:dTMP kinase
MSLFITFEGGEGSGKSFQARKLYRRLCQLAIPALLTHEPGVTPLGRKIARLLKWAQDVDISPVAELLLFNTSRAQLVAEVIRPNLESGRVVICDRYADSTTAYQGYGRGLDLAMVAAVNKAGTLGLIPDLTVLLDMPVREGLSRKQSERQDRFESEDKTFHQRVREGYLKMAAAELERWLVVDAAQSREKIAEIIWQRVSRLLPRQRGV